MEPQRTMCFGEALAYRKTTAGCIEKGSRQEARHTSTLRKCIGSHSSLCFCPPSFSHQATAIPCPGQKARRCRSGRPSWRMSYAERMRCSSSPSAGRRESAAQEWTRHLQEKKLLKAGTVLYQVAMLEDVPRFLRGMAIGGIRKGVPAERQSQFVVLVQDEAAWKKAVHHSSDDEPYLVRVNAAGVIQWRMAGRLTEARSQELAAQLK